MQLPLALAAILSAAALVHAHIAAFTKGMWCINGSTGDNFNSDDPVLPLYQLEFDQWWMHAFNGCNQRPPNPGDFLTLPSGDSVVLELASNQAFTSLSYGGRLTSDWPNGQDYPDNNTNPSCITAPNCSHDSPLSFAAIFSNLRDYGSAHAKPVNGRGDCTRYIVSATYHIPDGLPPCPEGGCICGVSAFLLLKLYDPHVIVIPFLSLMHSVELDSEWVRSRHPDLFALLQWNFPDVVNQTCISQLVDARFPETPTAASGNNIEVSGYDLSGEPKSPAYNAKCGFADGAQNDIFDDDDLSISESTLIKKSLRPVGGANDSIGESYVERRRLRRARKNIV
ncbi:hypothetical protein DFJ43DRAFT_1043287 [Lentinula guzmanii]|uniref:Uncharacterized protein n=1 Tax=Lentinula guzmanii TaxID=2804957 RepID=A0AA38MW35_9AGAR|nr:hypothetical protein DFJ43DRAFT_1043287 [Lentinula guzmanii]